MFLFKHKTQYDEWSFRYIIIMCLLFLSQAVSEKIELDVRLQNEDYERPCTNIQKRISRSYRGAFTLEGCSYPQYVTSLVVHGPVLKHLCSVYIERGTQSPVALFFLLRGVGIFLCMNSQIAFGRFTI